jgi:thioesterase domain-containing protein
VQLDNAQHLLPIFLLPGLGGYGDGSEDAPTLRLVADVLATNGAVTNLLHLPDIDRPAVECVDLEKVVAALTDSIMEKCGGAAPVVVGYSVGGFVAFEICRRLDCRGLPPKLLIMLDSSAFYVPAPRRRLIVQIADAARSNLEAAIATVPFLVAVRYQQLEAARRWLLLLRRIAGPSRAKGMRLALLVAYWLSAIREFRLGPYRGRVVLFKAKKTRPRLLDPALGWTPYAPQVEVVVVDGDHWSMLRNTALLEKIADAIRSLSEPRQATSSMPA